MYGYRMCECTTAVLPYWEKAMVAYGFIQKNLSGYITQGSYNTSVGASAGTHDGGGVLDIVARIMKNEPEKFLRMGDYYGIHWEYRTVGQGFGVDHLHGVTVGCPHLSPSAAAQMASFRRGMNGLYYERSDWPANRGFVNWREVVVREQQKSVAEAKAEVKAIVTAPVPVITNDKEIDMKFVLGTDSTVYFIHPNGTRAVASIEVAQNAARVLDANAYGASGTEPVFPQQVQMLNALIQDVADDQLDEMLAELKQNPEYLEWAKNRVVPVRA